MFLLQALSLALCSFLGKSVLSTKLPVSPKAFSQRPDWTLGSWTPLKSLQWSWDQGFWLSAEFLRPPETATVAWALYSPLYVLYFCVQSVLSAQSLQSWPTLRDPWTAAHQAPLSMGFSRQEYWEGCHFLLQGIFQTQGSNMHFLHLHWQADSLPLGQPGKQV